MPLSEQERKLLEELELEFRPAPPPPVRSRWWRISAAKRLAVAGTAVPLGLLSVVYGLTRDNAGGIALAVGAYVLVVGGLVLLVDGTPRARQALARRVRSSLAARPSGYSR